ncbi:UNKNOWN [Stylonychia lemnae]|uniref:Uncharacterized protein n=1 Tax=Stylonychia lemnae TaxID=5949 RepID=A0A078AK76_STYLE|nr:UNKNOWN [Stylonychia lemnae]|eukprot:CDW81857.1 UNKNOWN [Stylonychia lemnae]
MIKKTLLQQSMTRCFNDPEKLQKFLDRRLTRIINKDDTTQNLNDADLMDMKSSDDSFEQELRQNDKDGNEIEEKFDLTIDITQENDILEKEDVVFALKKRQFEGDSQKGVGRVFLQKRGSKQSNGTKRLESTMSVKRQRQSVDQDTESDCDLPKAQIIVRPELKNNEFLKMYQMNNNTHESDREKAQCISNNLQYNKRIQKLHPFFNKKEKIEPDINLEANDLFKMAQLTEQEYERLKGMKENDFQQMLHKERTLQLSPEGKTFKKTEKEISEKKKEQVMMIKIYDQLMKFRLKKRFGETKLKEEHSDSSFSQVSNLIQNNKIIKNVQAARNMTSSPGNRSRNVILQRPMTTINNDKSPRRVYGGYQTQTTQDVTYKSFSPNKTSTSFKNSSFTKEEKDLLKSSYSNIIQQVSQSNHLQLKKFHLQRMKEINKKFVGVQQYYIDDFVSFDKAFAEKIKFLEENQRTMNDYQFKSKDLIEREQMEKCRDEQSNAVDKAIFFTKVSPNSFIKVYTTKYHLKDNELLPFYRYQQDKELSLKQFKLELKQRKKEDYRNKIKTQATSRKQNLTADDKSKKDIQYSPPIKIIEFSEDQTPLPSNEIKLNFFNQDELLPMPLMNIQRRISNQSIAGNRSFTAYNAQRPRTNTDYNIFQDKYYKQSEKDTISLTKQSEKVFQEHQFIKDEIIQKTQHLNKQIKKNKMIFDGFNKSISKQKWLEKLVDSKIYGIDDAKVNYPDRQKINKSQSKHNKKQKAKNDPEASEEKLDEFDKYKQNFMKKVKIWNINELKKINPSMQKKFYMSIK